MSVKYRNASGQETIIAGLTPGGDIEAGAVMTRKGAFTVPALNAQKSTDTPVQVTFESPMPDNDYLVEIYPNVATIENFNVKAKAANGFQVIVMNASTWVQSSYTCYYIATKTYTVQHAQQNAESIAAIEAMIPTGAGSSNKLVTSTQLSALDSDLNGKISNIEDAIPAGASISNKLVTVSDLDAIEDSSIISYDNTVSGLSADNVKGAIDELADEKQDKLSFDNIPTANSSNPVKSGGVASAISDNYALMSINSAKNMVYFKNEVRTVTGVTYTTANGVVTTTGSATSLSYFTSSPIKLKAGKRYKLTGCPSGGSEGTFFLQAIGTNFDKKEYGSGHTFTCNADVNDVVVRPVYMNGTAAGHTFYPMLRLAQDPDNTFQPYGKTNQELSEDVKNIKGIQENVNYNGAKNLLPSPNVTGSVAGITYTKQSDGSYIATGATTTTPCYYDVITSYVLEKGTYILSSGADLTGDIELVLDDISSGSAVRVMTLIDSRERSFTLTNDATLHCYMWVASNTTLPTGGVHYYPMIRKGEDVDSTYVPYAMTNKQLTGTKQLDCTLASNTTFGDSTGHMKVCDRGGLVTLNIHAIKVTDSGTTWVTIGTLPSIIPAPNRAYTFIGSVGTSGNCCLFNVNPDKTIKIFNPASVASYALYGANVTYPRNTY